MQDQPLGKRSPSEGSDPTPCKRPMSRSPRALSWLATQSASAVCSPTRSWGCLLPTEPGLYPVPCQGVWQWAELSMRGGKSSLPPQQLGHPFYSMLRLSDVHLPTKRQSSACLAASPHPERAPHHRFPCLEGPSPTRLWDLVPNVFARCMAEVTCTTWGEMPLPGCLRIHQGPGTTTCSG